MSSFSVHPPDRPSLTKLGKGISSRSEKCLLRMLVQTDGWVLSPHLGPGLPLQRMLSWAGAVRRCTSQPPAPPQEETGAQTHMDMLRPHKDMKQQGQGHKVGAGETCMPRGWAWNGYKGAGSPWRPQRPPIRKKHSQALSGCGAAKPGTH